MIFKSRRTDKAEEAARASFKSEALVHMDTLYNAAVYLTRNSTEAEDLVQETLLKAFRFWDRYEPGTNCKAWLFRIQTNTFINRQRKKRPTCAYIDNADSDESVASIQSAASFYGTPETDYLSRLFPEHIKAAVDALPETFRLPVVLADLQDFSYKEIAEIMDCPVGTVMSRLFRGRQRLQEELFEYAVELGVIKARDARDDNGAISMEAYRQSKQAQGSGG